MVERRVSPLHGIAVVLLSLTRASGGEPLGGEVLAATPPASAGSRTEFPENPRRDLALQDDGSLWVVEPGSSTVISFASGLGDRSTFEIDPAIPAAGLDSPFDGVVGIAAIPGDPAGANLVLLNTPRPRIARVEPRPGLLALAGPFTDVAGLPAGAFLEGLDRSPASGELLTLDDAGRRALVLGPDLRVSRQVQLLGGGNPLAGAGIAWLDADAFLAGSSFGRPFALDLALRHSASSGLYSGLAVPLDSVEGILAGGLECGELAGRPALYAYDVRADRVVAVAIRSVPAPPPAVIGSTALPGGLDRRFTFQAEPGVEEVLVRENGVVLASVPPAGTFDLRGAVGSSALEFETRSGGARNPIVVPVHLFNGDWPAAEDPHERFVNISFDPGSPDFDPLDGLAGLALDWQGNREDSRLYVSSRRSSTIRVFDGKGKSLGSFDHRSPPSGTSGLALAPEREPSGKPRLMVLSGSPPPAGDGVPRWIEIDLQGNVLGEGPIGVDLLAPAAPAAVGFGDWDDLEDGYVVHDNASGRTCWIDGASMTVTRAVEAPTAFLGSAGAAAGPGGAASAFPGGMVLLAGGPPGSALATDAWMLEGPRGPSTFAFTGFSLAVLDLAVFRIHFCESFSSPACAPSPVSLPGIGFASIGGLETAYEESTGYDLAYFLTPDAVALRFTSGSASSIGTQGILTRVGARSRPGTSGRRLFDGVLDLAPGSARTTPSLRLGLDPDPGNDFFLHVINAGGGADLAVEVRVLLDGGAGGPALREEVSIPAGRFYRRRVAVPVSVSAAVELTERSGTAGKARVLAGTVGKPAPSARFLRGDADAGGGIDITDAVFILLHLFLDGEEPPCPDAADADDGGSLEITDTVAILGYLFLAGDAPPDPGPVTCGNDPTPDVLPPCLFGNCP